jgi:hypothetical protein
MPRENPNAGVLFGTDIAIKYGTWDMRNYRHLGQAAAEIQARLPAQLHARCGAAGRAARQWPSDSPFWPRPNDAVPSGLYGHPASARRATARRGRKLSALLAALLFAASGAAHAKSITAVTPSFFDVTKAIGSAVDGDTVIIPAGKASWTSPLIINKAITLTGQTTITSTVNGTADDKTIIQYNLTTSRSLIVLRTVAGKVYRISGLTFQNISAITSQNGLIVLGGYSQKVRLDHCHFDFTTTPQQARIVQVGGGVRGVADHNVFNHLRTQVFGLTNGCSPTDAYGNTSWSQPTAWGSADFFYIEDNYSKSPNSGAGSGTDFTDGDSGMKVVVRHNHLYNLDIVNHGTEGATRGGRAIEIYGNDVHDIPPYQSTGGVRSGSVLFHDNTWNAINNPGYGMTVFRTKNCWTNQQLTGWQGAAGNSPWDVNDTEGNGTYVKGHAPFQYWPTALGTSATAAAGTTSTQIVASGSPGWTTDKWKNFGLYKVDDGFMNRINSTTKGNANLVPDTSGYCGHRMTWAPGSPYQIFRCLVALDQSSRGQGDLLVGTANKFVNQLTGTKAWPHQVLDPAYSWGSRRLDSGAHINVHATDDPQMIENRDFYNEAAAVGGVQTVGVGVGLLANRPASGVHGIDIAHVTPDVDVPGTAYWATDVPSINGSTDKGALYVWRGGAWVLYYQPYTYPHPLTRDLQPPSNLQIVP